MAFKSKGGFVIRPIVTADSQGGANASIATINSSLATVNSRLTELESKVFPATVVSMDLVKLTDMTFDLTVVFSKTIRQLTSADLELTSCTAANFRRPSDTTQIITLTATSPTQFSYKIKEDSVAGRFVGSSLQTKVANTFKYWDIIVDLDPSSDYQGSSTALFSPPTSNPVYFGLRRLASGGGYNIGSMFYELIVHNADPYVANGGGIYYTQGSWLGASANVFGPSPTASTQEDFFVVRQSPYSFTPGRTYIYSGWEEVPNQFWQPTIFTKVY